MASQSVSHTGRCHCGAVEFEVKGNVVFNSLCHCRNCGRNRGVSPVQLLGVSPKTCVTFKKGQENVTTFGTGVPRCFCKTCGALIHQAPVEADFLAVTPIAFQIEGDAGSCLLPKELLPTSHMNYENRLFNWSDDLPKFKVWPGGVRMDNEGNEIA